jgi:hypothetical protein
VVDELEADRIANFNEPQSLQELQEFNNQIIAFQE